MTLEDIRINTTMYHAFRGMQVDGSFDPSKDWGEETALAVAWTWETCKGISHPSGRGTLAQGFYNHLGAPGGRQ